ncbi:MAG: hypothetical protein R6U70_10535 [Bacillota bacterium]
MPATHFSFTPSESKRLIARAVSRMTPVRRALKNGTVLICTGSTNAAVVEEITGEQFPHYQYLSGHILPSTADGSLVPPDRRPDVVLRKGRVDPHLDRFSALQQMQPDDVYIKGANALNYQQRVAGILIGGFGGGGSIGAALGHIAGRRLRLIIPVGLEKCTADDIYEVAERLNRHGDFNPDPPRMITVQGDIITEIEALGILAGVTARHIASGGIAGAEGAVWLLAEGTEEQVERARSIAGEVAGEPSFQDQLPH